jgi:hypothetical protein
MFVCLHLLLRLFTFTYLHVNDINDKQPVILKSYSRYICIRHKKQNINTNTTTPTTKIIPIRKNTFRTYKYSIQIFITLSVEIIHSKFL